MSRPVIALLTDFGLTDHYVGTMKGVALGICPEATFVDISHEIPPQDVTTGALELAASYPYFPASTVFLVVVDPGVGTSRRAVAVEAGAYRFVGPDNGVFSLVLERTPPTRAVELTDARYRRETVSHTFEGRDRFAPAAAWLASGLDLDKLGIPAGPLMAIDLPRPVVGERAIDGEVIGVDRFGNLLTNIGGVALESITARGPVRISVAGHEIPNLVVSYGEVDPGSVCALVGSTDALEIAVNQGSAAGVLDAGRGAAVRVAIVLPSSGP